MKKVYELSHNDIKSACAAWVDRTENDGKGQLSDYEVTIEVHPGDGPHPSCATATVKAKGD